MLGFYLAQVENIPKASFVKLSFSTFQWFELTLFNCCVFLSAEFVERKPENKQLNDYEFQNRKLEIEIKIENREI